MINSNMQGPILYRNIIYFIISWFSQKYWGKVWVFFWGGGRKPCEGVVNPVLALPRTVLEWISQLPSIIDRESQVWPFFIGAQSPMTILSRMPLRSIHGGWCESSTFKRPRLSSYPNRSTLIHGRVHGNFIVQDKVDAIADEINERIADACSFHKIKSLSSTVFTVLPWDSLNSMDVWFWPPIHGQIFPRIGPQRARRTVVFHCKPLAPPLFARNVWCVVPVFVAKQEVFIKVRLKTCICHVCKPSLPTSFCFGQMADQPCCSPSGSPRTKQPLFSWILRVTTKNDRWGELHQRRLWFSAKCPT